MSARLRTLREQRATAWSQVQDIQARREQAGYDPTDEDGETYSRALTDVERLSADIETEERAERLDAVMQAPDPDARATNPRVGADALDVSEQYRAAFDRYMRTGMAHLDADDQRLLEQGFVSTTEDRAQAVGAPEAGGYTVPEEFRARMIETLKAFGGLLSVVEILNTGTGAPLVWPTNDDTDNKGAILDENTAVGEQDLLFGQGKLGAYMYTSKMVRVSKQLLQDSAFNLNGYLPVKLGERIGRAVADHLATGTGTGQPKGLLTGLTKSTTTTTTGKIGYDDLVDLEHSIDAAYRNAGRARYVLADTAVRELRKLKDTQGRPLWVPSMAGGVPSTVNGQPYTIDNSFPEFAPGAAPIVFGDTQAAYIARVVAGAQTMRLAERFAEYLQVGFLGFQRLDGTVQDTSAAAKLEIKA